MAAVTTRTKLSLMDIDVTISTCLRRVCIDVVDMTFAAIDLFMTAIQAIVRSGVVVESLQRCPGFRCVTLVTRLTELPLVEIVMTIRTGCINGLEMSLRVTP